MKTEAELQFFFNSKLKPLLEPLEQFRIEKIRKFKRYLYITLSCTSFIVLGAFSKEPFIIFVSCIPMLIFGGITYSTFNEMSNHLRMHFKKDILTELLSFMFDKYEYIPRQRIAPAVLEESMLFPFSVTQIEGEDFMRFKIGETSIMFCETTVYTYKEKIKFTGIFIDASFNKSFTSKTFVLSKSFSSIIQNTKRHFLQNTQKVKLEDIEFDNEFTVLSTDQVEARYILTTNLMQRILDYKKKTKKGIAFSFVENRLYCAIPEYLDLFEPALFEPFDFGFIKNTYDPLKLYTDLVDDLHLNIRIWSKQ